MRIISCGTMDYKKTYDNMVAFTQSRKNFPCEDEVWLLEHDPVFTLGTSSPQTQQTNINNIPLVETNRGGDITYHGPGQLVGYLMINLRENKFTLHDLIAKLDNLLLTILQHFGIHGETSTENPGIYVDGKKIASYGLKVSQGCTYHGFSLNVDMDLAPFSMITPCGIRGIEMVNMKDLVDVSMQDVISICDTELRKVFG